MNPSLYVKSLANLLGLFRKKKKCVNVLGSLSLKGALTKGIWIESAYAIPYNFGLEHARFAGLHSKPATARIVWNLYCVNLVI